MTKNIIIAVLVIIIAIIVGENYQSAKELRVYKVYYNGAEELLDTLENQYNWVDAIDNDAYYTGVSEVHKLSN